MTNPHGSTPWSPHGGPDGSSEGLPGGDPASGSDAQPIDRPELVNQPVERTTIPIKIMIVSLVALVVTVGVIAFLFTTTTGTGDPDATPLPPEPTGAPLLPLEAGEYAREPGDAAAPPDFGVDRSIETSSAYYRQDGENALIGVAARPVDDPKVLLDQINVRAQRQVGEGWCGREETADLDVCILKRNRTAVLTVGLRDQTPEELIAATGQILAGTT